MKRIITLFAAVLITTAFGSEGSNVTFKAEVIYIVDGDTFVCQKDNGRKSAISLYGIDSPEFDQPYGPKAEEWLRSNLEGKTVHLELMGGIHGHTLAMVKRVHSQFLPD